ncbi:hypothetical protein [Bosea sp. RAC05]|uniref:hypothetical protein n=1 Tax=Bosea sp. RAC05 TaxID=1842539 RepID=UPI0008568573|nr:hypothetical protein [Bosea sp. RAC05]AOG02866.1 hypothetical protein BSY19_4864 [Bosea sp. RAC05]
MSAMTQAQAIQKSGGSWRIHDTKLLVQWPNAIPMHVGEDSRKKFGHILKLLRDRGFKVTADPEIKARSLLISPSYRYGRRGDLQLNTHVYPTGAEFHFYQDTNRTHARSGRYDFDQRQKMPYLTGKLFDLVIRDIERYLAGEGFVKHTKIETANPDPLAYFNAHWSMSSDPTRGPLRFKRGADGWPADSEINCWDRKDADGIVLNHGDTRHYRNHKGQLFKGRVYGGINGRWLYVYGPGARDFTHVSNWELFTAAPGAPRRDFGKAKRDARLDKDLQAALKDKDYGKAAKLIDVIKRLAERENSVAAAQVQQAA